MLVRQVKRDDCVEKEMVSVAGDGTAVTDTIPKLDLGFKEGQTIKINFTVSSRSKFCVGIDMLVILPLSWIL